MEKTKKLIDIGLRLMEKTRDPIHDRSHVERVIQTTRDIALRQGLSVRDCDALALAASWHDVARIITRRPSVFIMLALDDFFSAFMLSWYALLQLSFRYEIRTAIWLLLAKSALTGRIIRLTMLRRRYRTLLQILKDADGIDVVHPERTSIAFEMAKKSRYYRTSYRMLIRWTLYTHPITTYTLEARSHLIRNLIEMHAWGKDPLITELHTSMFGQKWAEACAFGIEKVIRENQIFLSSQNLNQSS